MLFFSFRHAFFKRAPLIFVFRFSGLWFIAFMKRCLLAIGWILHVPQWWSNCQIKSVQNQFKIPSQFSSCFGSLCSERALHVNTRYIPHPVFLYIFIYRFVLLTIYIKKYFQILERQKGLHTCMQVLERLNRVNMRGTNRLVPYDQFYIPQLSEKVDIKSDYIQWIQSSKSKVRWM